MGDTHSLGGLLSTCSIYLRGYSLRHNVLPILQSILLMTNGPLNPISESHRISQGVMLKTHGNFPRPIPHSQLLFLQGIICSSYVHMLHVFTNQQYQIKLCLQSYVLQIFFTFCKVSSVQEYSVDICIWWPRPLLIPCEYSRVQANFGGSIHWNTLEFLQSQFLPSHFHEPYWH